MRLNKAIQKLADDSAQEGGYFCASYLGRIEDEFVFSTRYSDSEPRCEGLPSLVIVKDGIAQLVMDVESFHYLNKVNFRNYRKGRTIYRKFERKVDEDNFSSIEERDYITEIVMNQQRPGYDVPIEKETLYDYLEIADRFGLMLDLVPMDYSMSQNDGWEYFLRLKSGKLEGYKLTSADAERFEVQMLYEEAFPEEERLPWEDLIRLTDAMPLDFTAYYDIDTFVGLTIVLPRENYNWFWYFAVNEQLRGKGYGQKILNHIIQQYQAKRLILDMESPRQECDNLDQRLRRRDFYLRNGFRDTEAEKTFEGITYTILMKGEGTFTSKDYDEIIAELRKFWKVPRENKGIGK